MKTAFGTFPNNGKDSLFPPPPPPPPPLRSPSLFAGLAAESWIGLVLGGWGFKGLIPILHRG